MSKIICDICGTSYQETAKQCPICGCVRPGDVQRVTNEVKNNGNGSAGYTYVKGGRFSKSNVKKRSKGVSLASKTSKSSASRNEKDTSERNNRGFAITAIVLLLAIIAVVGYIAVRYFVPFSPPDPTDSTTGPSSGETEPSENKTGIPCTGLKLDSTAVVFEEKGEAKLLSITLEPLDTTDVLMFKSSDDSVATVSVDGKITAVGNGTAIITATCGEISVECMVTCQLENETLPNVDPTKPTEGEIEPTKPPVSEFRLNRKDITFSTKGDSWVLYSGTIAKNLVSWSSDDDTIATFKDGKVVAVGPGTTKVHAEYEGEKISCIIRCVFEESNGIEGTGGVTEDGGSTGTTPTGTCSIYTQYGKSNDFTIKVNDIIMLTLKDAAGNPVSVTWTTNSDAIKITGNTLTAVSKTSEAKVSATYNGTTYTCIVRVS